MNVLVLGGGGFLGSFVVKLLAERRGELGCSRVVVFDVLDHVRLMGKEEDEAFKRAYVDEWIVGSILDMDRLEEALKDIDVCIHTASIVDDGTANPVLVKTVNVMGTETLLAAIAKTPRVRGLVYASSMDVIVADIFADVDGLDESAPYAMDVAPPSTLLTSDVYSHSKTTAERAVLKANKFRPGFGSCAIRPLGIFGERDVTHIGNVLKMACLMGRLNVFILGGGQSVFQHVYVGNCAWMHCLAAKKLYERDEAVAGQAFMGRDNTKVCNFFEFFEPFLVAKGYQVPWITLPKELAWLLACVVEDSAAALKWAMPRWFKGLRVLLTRRAVHALSYKQWFKTDKAKRLLGYEPLVGRKEALERSLRYFERRWDEFPPGRVRHVGKVYDHGVGRNEEDYEPDCSVQAGNGGWRRRAGGIVVLAGLCGGVFLWGNFY